MSIYFFYRIEFRMKDQIFFPSLRYTYILQIWLGNILFQIKVYHSLQYLYVIRLTYNLPMSHMDNIVNGRMISTVLTFQNFSNKHASRVEQRQILCQVYMNIISIYLISEKINYTDYYFCFVEYLVGSRFLNNNCRWKLILRRLLFINSYSL